MAACGFVVLVFMFDMILQVVARAFKVTKHASDRDTILCKKEPSGALQFM
jgi:hypothetical protein